PPWRPRALSFEARRPPPPWKLPALRESQPARIGFMSSSFGVPEFSICKVSDSGFFFAATNSKILACKDCSRAPQGLIRQVILKRGRAHANQNPRTACRCCLSLTHLHRRLWTGAYRLRNRGKRGELVVERCAPHTWN